MPRITSIAIVLDVARNTAHISAQSIACWSSFLPRRRPRRPKLVDDIQVNIECGTESQHSDA
eukprot:4715928-Prorocentrum_lima.AAC.1